jgi:hypothetical protein
MRTSAAIAIAALGFIAAGTAAAAERVTDAQFVQANRCRVLAASEVGGGRDTSHIDSFLKAQSRTRATAVLTMADNARTRAQRDASSPDRRARLQTELAGACSAYLDGGSGHAAERAAPKG